MDEKDKALEEIVARRMKNTGEDYHTAKHAVCTAIVEMHSAMQDGAAYDVFDDETGRIIGYRDKTGYHPNN